MYKIKLIACLTALILLLGGCRFIEPFIKQPTEPVSSTPVENVTVDADKYLDEFRNNWQYTYLNQRIQSCYGAMYTVLTDGFATDDTVCITEENGQQSQYIGVNIPLPMPLHSQEEAAQLYNAFFRDNPHFFYISGLYGLEGYMKEDQPYYDTLVLVYTMSTTERATAIKQMNTEVNKILAQRPQTGDDYETELYLHDQLAQRCSYDDTAATEGYKTHPHAFNAYGALVEGQAVCEGYSRAMQLLLKKCGIPSTLVIGRSLENDEEHMWNLVTINGRNYHTDVTWDDSEDRLRHTYFNLSTALLEQSRTVNDGQVGVDTCSATTDNYFVRTDRYIDTYDRDEIARRIAAAFQEGQTVIELRFAPDKYDNALLFLKNRTLTTSMVGNHLTAEDSELWPYQLEGDSKQHILTLVKE